MRNCVELAFCITGVLVFASVIQAEDVRGIAGVDYPNYLSIPKTSFSCSEQKYIPGFYADIGTKCQVFHFCFQSRLESFLCPVGTVFNQELLACDAWYNSNCSLAEMFYSVNAGPAMERAGRNLPMLLRLRNRSKGSPYLQMFSVAEEKHDKSSGSDNTLQSQDMVSSDLDDKSTLKSNYNEASEQDGTVVEGELKFKQLGGDNRAIGDEDETRVEQEVDTNIGYNPETDSYFVEYNAEMQSSEPESEEFSVEDYELPYVFQPDYTFDPDEDFVLDALEFSKRQLQADRSMRVRRKPTYLADLEFVAPDERRKRLNRDESESSESVFMADDDTSSSSEVSMEDGSETKSTVGPRAKSSEKFPRPTAQPWWEREWESRVTHNPMTTDEFSETLYHTFVESERLRNRRPRVRETLQQTESVPLSEQPAASYEDMVMDYQGDFLAPISVERKPLLYVAVPHELETFDGRRKKRNPDESESSESLSTDEFSDILMHTFIDTERRLNRTLRREQDRQAALDLLNAQETEESVTESVSLSDQPVESYEDMVTDYHGDFLAPISVDRKPLVYVAVPHEFETSDGRRKKRNPDESESLSTVGETSISSSDTSSENTSEVNSTMGPEISSSTKFPRPTAIPWWEREWEERVTHNPMTTDEFSETLMHTFIETERRRNRTLQREQDRQAALDLLNAQQTEEPGTQTEQPLNEQPAESREEVLNYGSMEPSVFDLEFIKENYGQTSALGAEDGTVADYDSDVVSKFFTPGFVSEHEGIAFDNGGNLIVIPDELDSEFSAANTGSAGTGDNSRRPGYLDTNLHINEQMYEDAGSDVHPSYEVAYMYYKPDELPNNWQREYQFYRGISPKVRSLLYAKSLPYNSEISPLVTDANSDDVNPKMAASFRRFENNRRSYTVRNGLQQDQPMSLFYGSEVPYSYGDFYPNPFVGSRGVYYDPYEYTRGYDPYEYTRGYDPMDSIWFQRDSNKNSDVENEFEVTDGLDSDTSSGNLYLNDEIDELQDYLKTISKKNSNEQAESYYLFDFEDEQTTKEIESNFEDGLSNLPENSVHLNVLSRDASSSNKNVLLDSELKAQSLKSHSILSNNERLSNSADHETLNAKSSTNVLTSSATESGSVNKEFVTPILERLSSLKAAESSRTSTLANEGSSDSRFKMSSESMDFGPFGIGNIGAESRSSSADNEFSNRKGETEQPNLSQLSAIQDRLRSMKQGKFGVFKKYMSSAGNVKE